MKYSSNIQSTIIYKLGLTFTNLASHLQTWLHINKLGLTFTNLASHLLTWPHIYKLGLTFTNLAPHLQTWPHIYKLGPTFTYPETYITIHVYIEKKKIFLLNIFKVGESAFSLSKDK